MKITLGRVGLLFPGMSQRPDEDPGRHCKFPQATRRYYR
jgi:hypothetical protein